MRLKRKNQIKISLVLGPNKSLNSLAIAFVVGAGEIDVVGGGGGRELVAPRPQGSDILTERLVSLVATVWLFPLHGLTCGFDAVGICHGSFGTVVSEVRLFVVSNDHGSSMRKKRKKTLFSLLFEED